MHNRLKNLFKPARLALAVSSLLLTLGAAQAADLAGKSPAGVRYHGLAKSRLRASIGELGKPDIERTLLPAARIGRFLAHPADVIEATEVRELPVGDPFHGRNHKRRGGVVTPPRGTRRGTSTKQKQRGDAKPYVACHLAPAARRRFDIFRSVA